jgi:hypothetical protein
MASNVVKTISKAKVGLRVDGTTVPLWSDSVTVVYNYQEFMVRGRPYDYISRVLRGGTISCTGLLKSNADIFAIMGYVYQIAVNDSLSFYKCRPLRFQISPGNAKWIRCSITYAFERTNV